MRGLPLALPLTVALLAAPACSDELANPVTMMCDLSLEIAVDSVPASLNYIVAAGGLALVNSVTFTSAAGDSTLTSPADEDENSQTYLVRQASFDSATVATLRVTGEISTGGQVGITYTVEPGQPDIAGPLRICGG